MMQICTARTAGDFWNYKTNISSGRSLLLDKRPSANTWLEMQKTAAAASGHTLIITDEHERLETIHRYNAGTATISDISSSSADGYYYWDSDEEMFEIIDKGGIGNYVSDVLAKSATCTN